MNEKEELNRQKIEIKDTQVYNTFALYSVYSTVITRPVSELDMALMVSLELMDSQVYGTFALYSVYSMVITRPVSELDTYGKFRIKGQSCTVPLHCTVCTPWSLPGRSVNWIWHLW